MKKYQLAFLLFAAVCSVSSAKKKAAPEILFGVKSGVITVSSDMGEMPDFGGMAGMAGMPGMGGGAAALDMSSMVQKVYFDDYGRKTASETIFGDSVTRTISIGDSTYTINEKMNTATIMPIFGGRGGRGGSFMGGMGGMGGASIGTIGQIDWLNLDEKAIKKNKIKDLGEEELAGVKCKKYTMKNTSSMGMTTTTTICIYKGITLKSESVSDWGTTTQSASAFEENAQIPATKFTLPVGCTVSEMSMGGFGGGMMMGGDFGGGGFGGGDFGGGGFGGGF